MSDGLTEIVIDTLSRLPDLRVMARSTVFDYKRKKIAPARAGKELNVGAVIAGHVRRNGDQLTIHVEMIDVSDGAQLWGRRYDTTTAELPFAQRRISDDLSVQLGRGIARQQRELPSRAYTTNSEGYEQYLLGLFLWNKRRAEDFPRSIDHFRRETTCARWGGATRRGGRSRLPCGSIPCRRPSMHRCAGV